MPLSLSIYSNILPLLLAAYCYCYGRCCYSACVVLCALAPPPSAPHAEWPEGQQLGGCWPTTPRTEVS